MAVQTIVLIVVLVVLVLVAAWLITSRRRSHELREQFGPEYNRAVEAHGTAREAEAELEARRQRVAALHVVPLSPQDRERFSTEWRSVQARFVDDPSGALREADTLVNEVMQTRGYPMSNFEQRAADISVDHPDVVTHYRAAHTVLPRLGDGGATTEDLRQALVHYRALFDELLAQPIADRNVA